MDKRINNKKTHVRLKKIIGQIEAIDRMLDVDEISCEDILVQLKAAKSALHSIGKIILEGHIKHCIRLGIENGNVDETIESFAIAVNRFFDM